METVEIDQGILERLYAVIEEELGVDPREIDPAKNLVSDLGLDSVQLTGAALRIDMDFGVSLPNSIMEGCTFGEFLREFRNQLDSDRPA